MKRHGLNDNVFCLHNVTTTDVTGATYLYTRLIKTVQISAVSSALPLTQITYITALRHRVALK